MSIWLMPEAPARTTRNARPMVSHGRVPTRTPTASKKAAVVAATRSPSPPPRLATSACATGRAARVGGG